MKDPDLHVLSKGEETFSRPASLAKPAYSSFFPCIKIYYLIAQIYSKIPWAYFYSKWRTRCYEYDSLSTELMSLSSVSTYRSHPYINYILIDRYFQFKFSEPRFRAMYVEMSMPFCEYYATSPKALFASNRPQNSSYNKFYYMNRCRFAIPIYWL